MTYICIVNCKYTNLLNILVSNNILYNSHMIIKVYASQAEIIKRLIIGYLISYDYNKPSNTLEIGFDFTILDIIVPYLTSNNIQFKLLNADDYSNTCCFC